MANRMPREVLEYLRSLGKKYGKIGGKTAAKNMTADERLARAKKASMAAAKKRTAERLVREGRKRGKQDAKRKRSA
jgi:predicted DNA-binding WGR domain protein